MNRIRHKQNNRTHSSRCLRLESLEERAMLAILAGTSTGFDDFQATELTAAPTCSEINVTPLADTLSQIGESSIPGNHLGIGDFRSAVNNKTELVSFTEAVTLPSTDIDYLNLNSKPDSKFYIYLDFDGHTTSSYYWNDGKEFVTPRFTLDGDTSKSYFTSEEIEAIYEIWLYVAEDYMPFDVNVTTCEPSASDFNAGRAQRVVIGGSWDDWYGSKVGGVSYIGSFTWKSDTPNYVFPDSLYSIKALAGAASHELGHSLGLSHKGNQYVPGNEEYYDGTNGWGPIMGTGYYAELTQWSKGEYYGATNTSDELKIITTQNGFGYRSDDYGNSFEDAAYFDISVGSISGIVEQNTDVDYFRFESDGSMIDFKIGGIKNITNLDTLVKIYAEDQTLLYVYDPADSLDVEFIFTEAAGTYYLTVEGTGLETSWEGIYSDYGSLGAYTISVVSNLVLVTTLSDTVADDDFVSLREAVTLAGERGIIMFDPSLSGGIIELVRGEIPLEHSVTIDASNLASITIDAKEKSGIFNVTNESRIKISNLILQGGRANDGAAINTKNGETILLNHCVFRNNYASSYGGAISIRSGNLNASCCTFSGNECASYGGAVYASSAQKIALENCVLNGNKSKSYGGAIYTSSSKNITITNTIFTDNSANYGGWIYARNSSVDLTNSTIASNSSTRSQGDLDLYKTDVTLKNSIFLGSVSENDSAISGYNTLSNFTNWTESANIYTYNSSNPLFNDAENGDYTLADFSQAIDVGNNDYAESYEYDLAGESRIVNGIVDLGAYEYQYTRITGVTVTGWKGLYDGNLHSITVDGTLAGDNIVYTYTVNGQTVTTSFNPTFMEIGTYEITVTVRRDGYEDLIRTASVIINKLPITGITITGWEGLYDGNAHAITVRGTLSGDNVTYTYIENGRSVTRTVNPTFTKIGTYKVTVTVSRPHSEDWIGTVSVTINKLPITGVTVTGWQGDFDGNAHSITVSGTLPSDSVTYTYLENGRTVTRTTNPTFVESGLYKITVTVSREYSEDWITTASVTISKPETLVVTTLNDRVDSSDGVLSLREAVAAIKSGGTITFAPALAGKTIALSGTEIEVSKPMTITADSVNGITINASKNSRIFYAESGTTLRLDNLTLTGGESDFGGAISNKEGGRVILNNCVLHDNHASKGGAAVYNINGSVLEINNSRFYSNLTEDRGSVIYNGGTITAVNSAFTGNQAKSGGVFYNGNNATINLSGCLLAQNKATTGSVIWSNWKTGKVNIVNSTITSNNVTALVLDGTNNISNSIVALNQSADINLYSGGTLNGYNVLTSFANWTASANISSYDSTCPLFTDSANGNYTLTENSQAIDKGNNTYYNTIQTDLAGNPRIVGNIIDLGAYEYQGVMQSESPSTVVTTLSDIVDEYDKLISLREAVSYAESGDTITFDSSLEGGIILLKLGVIEVRGGLTIDAGSLDITLDAQNASTIFSTSGKDVALTGLTLTNGSNTNGGAIYCSGTLTVTDCTFVGNTATYGAGIFVNKKASLTVRGSSFTGNEANSGAAIYAWNNSAVTLTDSFISGNSAQTGSAGVNVYGASVTMSNVVAWNNSSAKGATVQVAGGTAASLNAYNCTFADNTGTAVYRDTGTANLYNSILVKNTDGAVYGTVSGDFNLVEEAFGDHSLIYDGTKPLFAEGCYELASNSQAINAGCNTYVTLETDIAGNPRINGSAVDLGAYESRETGSKLEAPAITTGTNGIYVSHGANRHQIQWTAVSGASAYSVGYSEDGTTWKTVNVNETKAVITGLTYGADVQYRVKALGTSTDFDSDWSAAKTFNVCPMDINGDGEIAGTDRTLLAKSWMAEEGDDEYFEYADINADGEIAAMDRTYIASNWMAEADDEDLVYPRTVRADAVSAAFASGIDIDLDVF